MAKNKLEQGYLHWQGKAGEKVPEGSLDIPGESSLSSDHYLQEIGYPGEYPFTRGVQSSMYRGRLWTMRQYAGFGGASATNQRYHYLLSQGVSGLSVAFDLPTQMGRDPDHPNAAGEVGRVGVSIACMEDMRTLFSGIDLAAVSTSMTINATAHLLLAFYLVLARERGVSWADLRGTVQNDILKEYIARGTYIYPPKPAIKIAADLCEFCKDSVPQWNTMSISGYHIREAGSTAVQEIAFTLADGIAYVEELLDRGLEVDAFASRLAFFFNCHNNFLEEIAKFRAARRLWAKIMRERFGATSDRACMLRFHTQTAGSSLTAQQPLTNVVRTTVQALAAVLGGTQSLHTNSYDEALGLPTEEAAALAVKTQQVLAYETGVANWIDPFAGSYTIERLTDSLERSALEMIEQIDQIGGMVRAVELGVPQKEIEESAYKYQRAVESGEVKIVGMNFAEDGDGQARPAAQKIDPKLETEQIVRIQSYRSARDGAVTLEKLTALRVAAGEGRNILPPVIAAIQAQATLGEVSDVLREVFGEHSE